MQDHAQPSAATQELAVLKTEIAKTAEIGQA
jgi:hypothetical protein